MALVLLLGIRKQGEAHAIISRYTHAHHLSVVLLLCFAPEGTRHVLFPCSDHLQLFASLFLSLRHPTPYSLNHQPATRHLGFFLCLAHSQKSLARARGLPEGVMATSDEAGPSAAPSGPAGGAGGSSSTNGVGIGSAQASRQSLPDLEAIAGRLTDEKNGEQRARYLPWGSKRQDGVWADSRAHL